MFRRIPPLLMKRVLWIALPVAVVACAVLLVGWQQPEEPGIRFRFSSIRDTGYVSLDEKEVISLFHLGLSAFQFPADFPLTIDRSTVYLKAPIDTGQTLVPVSFSLSDDCAPSPDLKRLLCATPPGSAITYDLPQEQQDAATAAWEKYLEDYADFFVITPGIPQIYPILWGKCENCDYFFKTFCRWSSTTTIYCLRAYGTGFWGTSLFDLDSHSYVELPHEGELAVEDSNFDKGYLYYDSPFTLEVYDLGKAMVYQGPAEDWAASEDTIAFVGPCAKQSFCAGKLELDDHGLKTAQQQVLDASWSPENWGSRIMETRDEYLVTSNGRVFVLSKVTLQVILTFEYPEAKVERSQPPKTALYRGKDLMIIGSGDLSGVELTGSVSAFDLSKCQARLDDSCKVQSWNSIAGPVGSDPSRQAVRHHIYYLPAERPDLLLSIDEESSRLIVHNLGDGIDYGFELTGVPSLVAISTDGRFLLVGTRVDYDFVLPEDAQYHLFDLGKMRPDPRELAMRKNLFILWANAL